MRDSFGGTFMIYLLLIFLAVYIAFVAVAFNYARAFKVKDKVMDIIEQNEGVDFEDEGGALGEIETYLNNVNYKVNNITEDDCPSTTYNYINKEKGYCIGETDEGIYSVKTFVYINIPFVNFDIKIPVKGETRKIERINR